jgi:hypothetical protein
MTTSCRRRRTQPGHATCDFLCHAIHLTKEGDVGEAGEHVDAIERLITAYRTAVSDAV